MNWRPIETAPRDGTVILTCVDHPPVYAPTKTVWASYHPNSKGIECWRTASICGNKLGATHWMPMLPSPAQEGAAGANATEIKP